jgi:hypothetical protein
MNLWEEIEQLDQRIMTDKRKLKTLEKQRKDLHKGLHSLRTDEPAPTKGKGD